MIPPSATGGPFGPYAAMPPGIIETSLFFEKALA
jgi:hypothetical protein